MIRSSPTHVSSSTSRSVPDSSPAIPPARKCSTVSWMRRLAPMKKYSIDAIGAKTWPWTPFSSWFGGAESDDSSAADEPGTATNPCAGSSPNLCVVAPVPPPGRAAGTPHRHPPRLPRPRQQPRLLATPLEPNTLGADSRVRRSEIWWPLRGYSAHAPKRS